MSNRLTDTIRRQIVDKALNQTLAIKEAELKQREIDLGAKAYDEAVPKKLRDALANIPSGWVIMKKSVSFNANGWVVKMDFPFEKAVPRHAEYNNPAIGSVSETTADELQRWAQDKKSLAEERDTMSSKLRAMLGSFYTFKQMRDRWPAGSEFYDEFDHEKTNVPMIMVEDINKMLGIGGKEEE